MSLVIVVVVSIDCHRGLNSKGIPFSKGEFCGFMKAQFFLGEDGGFVVIVIFGRNQRLGKALGL